MERICFQVEEAQWFYEDFIRPLDPDLPSLNLRNFCLQIFQHCPLFAGFSSYEHATAFSEFLAYKIRVPVRGAILLNDSMDQVILVKGWKKGANWSFPRGKINKDEPDLDCAIREVYEETGYDLKTAGLVGKEEDMKSIEVSMREQNMKLYVFRGVPMDTRFEPRTRKEISKIQWYKLSDLPTLKNKKQQQEGSGQDLANNANKFYMVAPLLHPLKNWIKQQRKIDKLSNNGHVAGPSQVTADESDYVQDAAVAADHPARTPLSGMENLMAKLRKAEQMADASDLPEVTTASDASVQLKSFLGVPAKFPTFDKSMNMEHRDKENLDKNNALLALLKPRGEIQNQIGQLPQTPSEQIIKSPEMPHPPHHHPVAQHDPVITSPPNFPTNMPHISQQSVLSQLRASQYTAHQASNDSQHQPTQLRTDPTEPLPLSHQPQQPHGPTSLHSRASETSSQYFAAPYQRTGDPFAENTRSSNPSVASVPPASKLPPPKLTKHSSALLDLFKPQQSPKSITGEETSLPNSSTDAPENGGPSPLEQQQHFAQPRQPKLRSTNKQHSYVAPQFSVRKPERQQSVKGSVPVSNAPTLEKPVQGSFQILSRPKNQSQPASGEDQKRNLQTELPEIDPAKDLSERRSEHQNELLNMFRESPHPNAQAKPPSGSLQPPPIPVELSAMPSPGLSRAPSLARQSAPKSLVTKAPKNQSPTRQHPRDISNRKPNVSATVSGPLNVPQFEIAAKKAKDSEKHANRRVAGTSQKRSPMTILARPASSASSLKTDQPQEAVKTPIVLAISPKAPSPTQLRPTLKPADSNPKITVLSRPQTGSFAAPKLNEPSPIQPLPSPTQRFRADRRAIPTQEHKKSLLSLFTKSSPVASPSGGSPADLVSPLTEKTGSFRKESLGSMPRSKVGSLDMTAQNGSPKVGARNAPSRTTGLEEKKFLLGFLEGVANGKKR